MLLALEGGGFFERAQRSCSVGVFRVALSVLWAVLALGHFGPQSNFIQSPLSTGWTCMSLGAL